MYYEFFNKNLKRRNKINDAQLSKSFSSFLNNETIDKQLLLVKTAVLPTNKTHSKSGKSSKSQKPISQHPISPNCPRLGVTSRLLHYGKRSISKEDTIGTSII